MKQKRDSSEDKRSALAILGSKDNGDLGRDRNAPSSRRTKTEMVERICDYIKENPSEDLSLNTLESRFNISRYTIQRSFKDVMGITPRKYVEECRILLLKRNLRKGEPVPQAIYKTGYNSQSWLYQDPESKLGMTLSSFRKGGKGTSIRYLTAPCKLGFVLVAETAHGICSISLADTKNQLVENLHREYPNAKITESEEVTDRLCAVLGYFEGNLPELSLDVGGTEFQRRVWAAISSIPYGETRSYNDIAEDIGMPKAYRAVANACGANPVPLIVPCHRVIRKDGGLGGYGLGIERKKYLLDFEKRNVGKSH